MMSEKRFVATWKLNKILYYSAIIDNTEKKVYRVEQDFSDVEKVVDLLNEQQATISKQLDQIIELQDKYRILEFNHSRLEKRNKAQYDKLNEQQSIIDKQNELLDEISTIFRNY